MIFFVYPSRIPPQTDFTHIRWLDVDHDYYLVKKYWKALDQEIKPNTWQKAHEYGYSYAGLIEDKKIISCAGVWRFSDTHWEVSAVSTLPGWRQKGYSQRVVAFVTAYILKTGHVATCSTEDENLAMIRTAESVGFNRLFLEQVTWRYPRLPDF